MTAEVPFPEVRVTGLAAGPQSLSIQYDTNPSANSCDWSADPAQILETSRAEWEVPLQNATTPSQIVIGTNHRPQRVSNVTLIAGLLFGIGGSALIDREKDASPDGRGQLADSRLAGGQRVRDRPGATSSGEKYVHPADCPTVTATGTLILQWPSAKPRLIRGGVQPWNS